MVDASASRDRCDAWACRARPEAEHLEASVGALHSCHPLRDPKIEQPNHVWCVDIADLPIGQGLVYLMAMMSPATQVLTAKLWISPPLGTMLASRLLACRIDAALRSEVAGASPGSLDPPHGGATQDGVGCSTPSR